MAGVTSLVGLALMVAGLVALLLGHQALSASPLAIALQVSAIALMLWARLAFGLRSFHATASPTAGGLVTTGPYRWIRHPIYTAICLFGWACCVGHPSWFSVEMAGLISVGGLLRMRMEESLLIVRYPEYAEYARRTSRMIPFVF